MLLQRDARGTPIQVLKAATNNVVNFTTSSMQSPILASNVVRVVATDDCYISFGPAPTATLTSMYMPGGLVEYFSIDENDRIAVISEGSGVLHITEME